MKCRKTEEQQGSKVLDCKKALKIWARMTRSGQASPYTRMNDAAAKNKSSKADDNVRKSLGKGKENHVPLANAEMKEKKPKRKGWKRIRHAALVTCRYIGMGVSHMGAGAAYPTTDFYHVDPKNWNKSYSSSYNRTNKNAQIPHWTTNMMLFSGW